MLLVNFLYYKHMGADCLTTQPRTRIIEEIDKEKFLEYANYDADHNLTST